MINLFIWPSESATDDGLHPATYQDYQIVHWNQTGTTFWAISDLNASELRHFTQLIRGAERDSAGSKD